MTAANNPVRRPGRELHTGDMAIAQKDVVESREDLDSEIVVAPEQLHKEYVEALAFAEEPVTIRIERGSEKFAPPMVDLWVQGRGAEVLINGRWVVLGYLPVGFPITTKRKYVEVLAASKHDAIQTKVLKEEHSERNLIERFTSAKAPFSVLEDKNPKGAEWLTNLVRFG